MCWGLSVGDGWYKIIWDLSQKLEPLIQKFIDENSISNCYQCGCDILDHEISMNGCRVVHRLPYNFGPKIYGYPIPQWRRDFWKSFKKGQYPSFKHFWKYQVFVWLKAKIKKGISKPLSPVNRLMRKVYSKWNIGYNLPCKCSGFKLNHPCASQVKEKFGGLRFYMTSATNEMYDLISKAENKASETCEACGQPGEERNGGWVLTLCDECHHIRETDRSKPAWKILEERSPYNEDGSNSLKT